jgi:hypothetical protein
MTVQLLPRGPRTERVADSKDKSQPTLARIRKVCAQEIQVDAAEPLRRELVIRAASKRPGK